MRLARIAMASGGGGVPVAGRAHAAGVPSAATLGAFVEKISNYEPGLTDAIRDTLEISQIPMGMIGTGNIKAFGISHAYSIHKMDIHVKAGDYMNWMAIRGPQGHWGSKIDMTWNIAHVSAQAAKEGPFLEDVSRRSNDLIFGVSQAHGQVNAAITITLSKTSPQPIFTIAIISRFKDHPQIYRVDYIQFEKLDENAYAHTHEGYRICAENNKIFIDS